MTLGGLLTVLEILDSAGFGKEYMSAEHDILYLPGRKDVPYAERLISLGAFWDEDVDSWAIYT